MCFLIHINDDDIHRDSIHCKFELHHSPPPQFFFLVVALLIIEVSLHFIFERKFHCCPSGELYCVHARNDDVIHSKTKV